jgi:hypothetical protein
MAAYSGGVAGLIPYPTDYTNMADVPAILQDRTAAILAQIKAGDDAVRAAIPAAMSEATFQTYLDKFIQSQRSRLTHDATNSPNLYTLPLYASGSTQGDVGLACTVPFTGKVLALVSWYANLEEVSISSGVGDIRLALTHHFNGTRTAMVYEEHTISEIINDHMLIGASTWECDGGATLKMELQRGSSPSACKVGTRWIHVTAFRISDRL